MGNCARFGAVNGDGLPRQKDRRERESVCVLLCCLAENWTEEGQLQCGCPPRGLYSHQNTVFIK
jgi:hypothetical protein